MPYSLRHSAVARLYYRLIENNLLPKIESLSLTPNQCTLIGLVLALTVPIGFFVHPLLGFFFMGVSGLTDSIDGLLARRTGRKSDFGAFLDSSLDRLSDFAYLFGFWTLFWDNPGILLATTLLWVAFLVTVMISYVKARAESLSIECGSGLLERGGRTVYLLLWALLLGSLPGYRSELLWSGLALYALLASITLLQRFLEIHRRSHSPISQ